MIETLVQNCLIGAICGVWAFLFSGPLSEPEEVFGWIKAWSYKRLPWWLHKPLIGCAKCNAFWWAAVVMSVRLHFGLEIGIETMVLAVFTAYALQQHFYDS